MKKLLIGLLCLSLCLSLFLSPLAVRSFADFGDYAGDSDFGGFDFDSGGDFDIDFGDYGSRSHAGHSSGSSTFFEEYLGILVIFVLFWGVLFLFSFLKSKFGKKRGGTGNAGATPTDRSSLRSMSEYGRIDRTFSPSEFNEKISRLYVQFQNAWQAKDLEELRPYLSDAFYATADRQLDAYRRNHQTNHVERIAVLGVELLGFRQENGEDIIIADLRTRIVDYVTDDATGKIVRGNANAEKFMHYEWTLARKTGVITANKQGTRVIKCPNCGAPLNINKTAKCEYCDSIVTVDSNDWVVTGIKAISQQTR